MTSIKQLRQSGYKVRVHHKRELVGESLSPLGGATKVEITTPDGKNLVGEAFCSKKDNYNKKVGAAIAIGRALKNV